MAFHEIQFPTDISKGATGGPKRLTDIVMVRGGSEQRNTIWADSRREYNAGLGLRSMADVYDALDFFEGRRGMLHGFRWKDWADYRSTKPNSIVADDDVLLGIGDNATLEFPLKKVYSPANNPYTRFITKPVAGTVLIALDGVPQVETVDFDVNYTTGIVTFDTAPGSSVDITAGFEFDVPVRFNIDQLEINVELFNAGSIPAISIVEIRV